MFKFHLLVTYIHQLYVDAMLMSGIGDHTTVVSLTHVVGFFGVYIYKSISRTGNNDSMIQKQAYIRFDCHGRERWLIINFN